MSMVIAVLSQRALNIVVAYHNHSGSNAMGEFRKDYVALLCRLVLGPWALVTVTTIEPQWPTAAHSL